jgi:hypothetical protein
MENTSLHPLTCGFCNHSNPANSRYCNACGAPLRVQSCPQCGSVNDANAATCQECDAALADSGPNEFFLPLPPEAPADAPLTPRTAATTFAPGPAAADATAALMLEERPPVAERPGHGEAAASGPQPARAAAAALSPDRQETSPVSSPLPPDRDAGATSDVTGSAPEPAATAAVAVSVSGAHTDGGGSGSGWRGIKSLVVLTAIGVGVFFAYRHFQRFQPSDAAPRPAASSENRAPVQPETTAPTATTAATGEATKPPIAADGAGSKGSRGAEPARAAPAQPPTDIFIVKPEPDKTRPQPPAQEAQKAAAASSQGDVKRPANGDRAGTAQRASGSAACPDGMAALGLCKP